MLCASRLKESLAEALAVRDEGHTEPSFSFDSPAEMALMMVEKIMLGGHVGVARGR